MTRSLIPPQHALPLSREPRILRLDAEVAAAREALRAATARSPSLPPDEYAAVLRQYDAACAAVWATVALPQAQRAGRLGGLHGHLWAASVPRDDAACWAATVAELRADPSPGVAGLFPPVPVGGVVTHQTCTGNTEWQIGRDGTVVLARRGARGVLRVSPGGAVVEVPTGLDDEGTQRLAACLYAVTPARSWRECLLALGVWTEPGGLGFGGAR